MKLSELLAKRPDLDHGLGLEDDDMVTEVISLLRIVRADEDGFGDSLMIGAADSITGIVQHGIVSAANLQVAKWMTDAPDE